MSGGRLKPAGVVIRASQVLGSRVGRGRRGGGAVRNDTQARNRAASDGRHAGGGGAARRATMSNPERRGVRSGGGLNHPPRSTKDAPLSTRSYRASVPPVIPTP